MLGRLDYPSYTGLYAGKIVVSKEEEQTYNDNDNKNEPITTKPVPAASKAKITIHGNTPYINYSMYLMTGERNCYQYKKPPTRRMSG